MLTSLKLSPDSVASGSSSLTFSIVLVGSSKTLSTYGMLSCEAACSSSSSVSSLSLPQSFLWDVNDVQYVSIKEISLLNSFINL